MSISSMIILCFILNKYFAIEGLVIGANISTTIKFFIYKECMEAVKLIFYLLNYKKQ